MEIQIYNTMTRRKETFRPVEPGKVRMYNCGPTVYDQAQLNNKSNRLIGRACVNCHSNIHGSNHPAGVTFLR